MNVVLQIMIALSILVPPQGTKEVRFQQRSAAGKDYVNDVEFVLRQKAANEYVLSFVDRSAGASDGKQAAPQLSVSVVDASKYQYLVTFTGKDTHPYMSNKKHNIELAKLVELPARGDFANASTLKQVLWPEADGLIRLTHDKATGQLIVKWPTTALSSSEYVLSYKPK